ncbi:MAG: MFS transporter, partial [Pelolinea sp.]|nr:MFS transporter [Pelolinea sp.]
MEAKHSHWQRTFIPFWVGQAFSLLGSELVQFSLIWYLTNTTGEASVLAIASFVALLPRVFFSPIAGALVDRFDRKKVMIFADAFIALATLILAGIFWFGLIQVWHIYVILFIRSLGSGFHWPAMQASTSLLVPKEQLSRISGINQTLRGALGITSPLIAAILLESLQMFGIIFIDILTAVIAITTLLFIAIPQTDRLEDNPKKLTKIFEDIQEGFKYLLGWQGLFYLTIAAALLNFLVTPGYTFTPLLITGHFKKGIIELSMVESVFSMGMIIGGLVLSIWGGFKRNIYTILLGILGLAVGTGLIAAAPADNFFLALIGMALAGFMNPITNGPIFAIIQSNVEPEMQGRVFSLLETLVSAMMPISMLIAAPIAKWIGIRGWLAFGAVGCLVIGVVGFFLPPLIQIEDNSKGNG